MAVDCQGLTADLVIFSSLSEGVWREQHKQREIVDEGSWGPVNLLRCCCFVVLFFCADTVNK